MLPRVVSLRCRPLAPLIFCDNWDRLQNPSLLLFSDVFLGLISCSIGATSALVFHCAYGPRMPPYSFRRRCQWATSITALFPHPSPRYPRHRPPPWLPSYVRVCPKVGVSECGQISNKIHSLRTGEGRRLSRFPFGVTVDGTQPEWVNSCILKARFSSLSYFP